MTSTIVSLLGYKSPWTLLIVNSEGRSYNPSKDHFKGIAETFFKTIY